MQDLKLKEDLDRKLWIVNPQNLHCPSLPVNFVSKSSETSMPFSGSHRELVPEKVRGARSKILN